MRIACVAAIDQVAAMVHNDITNDHDAASMRRLNKMFQVRHAARADQPCKNPARRNHEMRRDINITGEIQIAVAPSDLM